jgi:hypothetical protein
MSSFCLWPPPVVGPSPSSSPVSWVPEPIPAQARFGAQVGRSVAGSNLPSTAWHLPYALKTVPSLAPAQGATQAEMGRRPLVQLRNGAPFPSFLFSAGPRNSMPVTQVAATAGGDCGRWKLLSTAAVPIVLCRCGGSDSIHHPPGLSGRLPGPHPTEYSGYFHFRIPEGPQPAEALRPLNVSLGGCTSATMSRH